MSRDLLCVYSNCGDASMGDMWNKERQQHIHTFHQLKLSYKLRYIHPSQYEMGG